MQEVPAPWAEAENGAPAAWLGRCEQGNYGMRSLLWQSGAALALLVAGPLVAGPGGRADAGFIAPVCQGHATPATLSALSAATTGWEDAERGMALAAPDEAAIPLPGYQLEDPPPLRAPHPGPWGACPRGCGGDPPTDHGPGGSADVCLESRADRPPERPADRLLLAAVLRRPPPFLSRLFRPPRPA
jgi:hypothetical protein